VNPSSPPGSRKWPSLLNQAREFMSVGAPFPVQGVSNRRLAQLLFRLAHGDRGEIRFAFGDGSVSTSFPLPPLAPPIGQAEWSLARRPLVPVGLISRRHPVMDREVELYLLRNAQVRATEGSSDCELLAYDETRRFLDDALDAAGDRGLLVELYQTGLEPAVIGFWRAACDTLRERPSVPLRLRPRFKSPVVRFDVPPSSIQGAEAVARQYPDFFVLLDAGAGRGQRLQWRPERPMRRDECDEILGQWPDLGPVVEELRQRSQYKTGPDWGR
jgi:hypothetical protein